MCSFVPEKGTEISGFWSTRLVLRGDVKLGVNMAATGTCRVAPEHHKHAQWARCLLSERASPEWGCFCVSFFQESRCAVHCHMGPRGPWDPVNISDSWCRNSSVVQTNCCISSPGGGTRPDVEVLSQWVLRHRTCYQILFSFTRVDQLSLIWESKRWKLLENDIHTAYIPL